MATYQARWGPKGFIVSQDKIVSMSELATSLALKKDSENDTSGTPPTNTRGRELRPITFKVSYYAAAGVDPRDQIRQWEAELGNFYPLFIEGKRFGAEKMMLTQVATSDIKLSNTGRFISCVVSITLEEYANGKTSILVWDPSMGDGSAKYAAFSATADGPTRARLKPGKEEVSAL